MHFTPVKSSDFRDGTFPISFGNPPDLTGYSSIERKKKKKKKEKEKRIFKLLFLRYIDNIEQTWLVKYDVILLKTLQYLLSQILQTR